MKYAFVLSVLALAMASSAFADVYMHNPRGSNNRCDEQSNNRANANRLFNSQNNAAGGYPVAPPLYFYTGSVLTLEWTNQHSCGGEGKINCDIVWQYSCDNSYKDGEPDDPSGGSGSTCIHSAGALDEDNQNNKEYGRHESYNYFDECNQRERNKGLFTADRGVSNGNGAQATRQNNGGGVSGFECQEERDYYPYWHPTPWVDIAVLTSNTSRCDYYRKESENVKARNYCSEPMYNNQDSCKTGGGQWLSGDQTGRLWTRAPDCDEAPWTRSNSLTSTQDGFMPSYNWTIPLDWQTNCVLRLRYNMSTNDYDSWNTDYKSNGAQSPVSDEPDVPFQDMVLSLAIDTSQFGRTFQDRSHVFEIRPSRFKTWGLFSTVYNLNVRGKRGNIAQVRNCVEYDFVPQRLHVRTGDYIHFQWTGSNHQPDGNAGEGKNRWDRSNIVQMINNDLAANYFEPLETQNMFGRDVLAYRAAHIAQELNVDCATQDDVDTGAVDDQDPSNCAKLNGNPSGYFDVGIYRMNRTGEFNYMSTRNNNFSNRGQKGQIIVRRWLFGVFLLGAFAVASLAFVGAAGVGVFLMASGTVSVPAFMGGAAAGGAAGNKRRSWGSSGSGASGASRGTRTSAGSARSKSSKSSFGGSMI